MVFPIFRSLGAILFLLLAPNLARSTEEIFDIKGRPVLSGSPVKGEETVSTSGAVRRRGSSLCWQMTKLFGAAYLVVMGSEESSSDRALITRNGGNHIDLETSLGAPEVFASSWGLLAGATASEVRREEDWADWMHPEEKETTKSVFLSLRGHQPPQHKNSHQFVLVPEESESSPSLEIKNPSKIKEKPYTPRASSMRFATVQMPWKEFLHHVRETHGNEKNKIDRAFEHFGEIDSFEVADNPPVELFRAAFGRFPESGDEDAMGYISENFNKYYHKYHHHRKSDRKRRGSPYHMSEKEMMVDEEFEDVEEDLAIENDKIEDENNLDNLEQEPNPAEEEEEALYKEEEVLLSLREKILSPSQKSQLGPISTSASPLMRFSEAKHWGHARGRVLGRLDDAAAVLQFGVEDGNGEWFTLAMAADANARGDRARDVFNYLDHHADIGWQKLRAEVAHWAVPIMRAGNFNAYGGGAPAIPHRIYQASHMRAHLRDEGVCATPPCVGFEFEIPTFTMVYHETGGNHHIPKESKVGVLYRHGGKFKYVGELGGTMELVTFPLDTAGTDTRDSARSLSNRLRTLYNNIIANWQGGTANIRVRNDNGAEYRLVHYYQDTDFMATEFIHEMRPNVLYPFSQRPVDHIRFGLDDSGDRSRAAGHGIRYYFKLSPHVTLGVAPGKLSKFLELSRDGTHMHRYDRLFLNLHRRLINAARGRLNSGDGTAGTCNEDSAGAGLAWLIGTYLETYEDNAGAAFSGNDPKRSLPIMARTHFRALAHAVHTHDGNWNAFIRCLGNFLEDATPRYFNGGHTGEQRLNTLFGLANIDAARQSNGLGGHRIFTGTTYPSERANPGTAALRDLYGYAGGNCRGPTVESWLYSVRHDIGGMYHHKDLLSPPTCFHLHDTHPEGMGSMGMKDNLAILELRAVRDPCKDYAHGRSDCTIRQLTGATQDGTQHNNGRIETFMRRFKELSDEAHL